MIVPNFDGLRDQVTDVLLVPLTVAVNAWFCDGVKVTLAGLIVKVTTWIQGHSGGCGSARGRPR